MGQPKQLLLLGDKPAVRRCADNIVAAGIGELVVVAGPDANAIVGALSGLSVRIAVNDATGSDMAGSVRTGLSALEQTCSGVLVCLADHPLASAETMRTLAAAHQNSPNKIVIPSFGGKRGHPTLFPLPVLREVLSGGTLRDIVRLDPTRVREIDTPDEGTVLDMDTPGDYERIQARMSG
jgi:molybdenum cofactor cytidylyltransferase